MQVIFRDLHVCRKKHVLLYYAHAKPLHSVKWRSLYGDTATMQELLLKRVQDCKEEKNMFLKRLSFGSKECTVGLKLECASFLGQTG